MSLCRPCERAEHEACRGWIPGHGVDSHPDAAPRCMCQNLHAHPWVHSLEVDA